jgi:hypothetical protein
MDRLVPTSDSNPPPLIGSEESTTTSKSIPSYPNQHLISPTTSNTMSMDNDNPTSSRAGFSSLLKESEPESRTRFDESHKDYLGTEALSGIASKLHEMPDGDKILFGTKGSNPPSASPSASHPSQSGIESSSSPPLHLPRLHPHPHGPPSSSSQSTSPSHPISSSPSSRDPSSHLISHELISDFEKLQNELSLEAESRKQSLFQGRESEFPKLIASTYEPPVSKVKQEQKDARRKVRGESVRKGQLKEIQQVGGKMGVKR